MEAFRAKICDHLLRIREALFIEAQKLLVISSHPAIDMDDIRRHSEFQHSVCDVFHLFAAHIAHLRHPEAKCPAGDHRRSAAQPCVVIQKALHVAVCEQIVVQIRILGFHRIGNAGACSHVKMCSGIGIHQYAVALRTYEIRHSLVRDIGIG